MMRRRSCGLIRLPFRRLHGSRDQVVHEVRPVDIPVLVILDLLEERRAKAHGESPVNLSLHDERIDYVAAVVNGHETADLGLARSPVYIDDANVASKGEGHVWRI